MKFLTCLLICAGLAAGQLVQPQPPPPSPPPTSAAKPAPKPAKAPGTKPATSPKPAARTAAKPPTGFTIPAGAKQVEPGLFRWTDPNGKTWMYRTTPFGVSRWAASEEDTKLEAVAKNTTAVEQGDSIKFERVTPFGKRTWVVKKTDMDETEQAIWDHQQQKTATAKAAKE